MNNIFIKLKKSFALAILVLALISINFLGCKKELQVTQSSNLQKIPKTSVIGGSETSIQNIPYQAAVFFNGNFHAGGVILNDRWIMTAAHVVTGANSTLIASGNITVRLGSSYVNSGTSYNADFIVRHPNYNSSQINDDIALIHLSSPISFDLSIAPIPFATSDEEAQITVNMPATVSGWGATSYNPSTNTATYPNYLFSGDVKISSIAPSIIYTSSATGQQQAPCFGDSGGPLVVNIPGKGKILVGVVNGWGDCNVGEKGYARISSYASWIRQITGFIYYNTLQIVSFEKNDCQSNMSDPIGIRYIVPARKHSSTISQADADAKALLEINQSGGQQNANLNGFCYLPMATPSNTHHYPPNQNIRDNGYRYLQNINWDSSFSPLDSYVKIELLEMKSAYSNLTTPGFNSTYIVNQVINASAPNIGQLLNGLDSDVLGYDNILGKTFRIRITAINSGVYYLSDDFDLEWDN